MPQFISPKELAQAIGASESSLKRWADDGHLEVSRTAGGHRRIPIAEAVRFVRSRGMRVLRPDVLGFGPNLGVVEQTSSLASPEGRLTEYLMTGRLAESYALINGLYLEGLSIAEIADGPIASAMSQIGELWHHSSEGILIEHRATEACIHAINMLRAVIEPENDNPLTAVGCSLEKDPYTLATLVAAAVVSEQGFHATNLGANLPIDVLRNEIDANDPTLVWISFNVPIESMDVVNDLVQIADVLGDHGGLLVIGGRETTGLELPSSPSIRLCSRMQDLAETASWVRASRQEN